MWSQVLTNSCLLFSCGNPTYLLHKGISTDRSSREYIEKISRVFRSFCFFFFLTTIGLVVLDELVWLILPMLMHIKRFSKDKGTTSANPAHFQTALRTLKSFVSSLELCFLSTILLLILAEDVLLRPAFKWVVRVPWHPFSDLTSHHCYTLNQHWQRPVWCYLQLKAALEYSVWMWECVFWLFAHIEHS